MVVPNILVVDSDEGFGNMLKEGLNNSGSYQAIWVDTGREAMKTILATPFDLVIIDMALSDVSPIKLVQAIRKAKSELRIMFIPLLGQQLPEKVEKALKINGVLTKPFFVGDLPDIVNKALGRTDLPSAPPIPIPPSPPEKAPDATTPTATEPVNTPSPPTARVPLIPPVPQDTVRYLRGNEQEILRLLNDLNREVRAEAIMLIAGQELIAQAGLLGREQCLELTVLVAQSSQAAAQAADFLGEKAKRFAQSLHEGKEYRVYTLTISDGILLSLALSSNVPLGMIRHQCRHIAGQLAQFI